MSRTIPPFLAHAPPILVCLALVVLCAAVESSAQEIPAEGRRLHWGEVASGRFLGAERAPGQDREVQYWALDVRAGQTASVQLHADQFDARLYVTGSELFETARNRDDVGSNEELIVTFPETATYRVGVEAYGSAPEGSYTLTVTAIQRPRR